MTMSSSHTMQWMSTAAATLLMFAAGCAGSGPTRVPRSDAATAPVMDGAWHWDGSLPDLLTVDQGPGQDVLAQDAMPAADLPAADSAVPPFVDVPASHPQAAAIAWVRQHGYMVGCSASPPQFCPDATASRAQAAVAIIRMKFGASFGYSPAAHFSDVPASHWAFKHIQKMKDAGITNGCSAGKYCPEDATLRRHAATFIVVAKYGSGFQFSQSPHFSDVAQTDASFQYIQKMRDAGITQGCTVTTFCPDAVTTRAQLAGFLYNAQSL